MKKKLLKNFAFTLPLFFAAMFSKAQAPVANFSISPSPACAGQTITLTDMSTNVPTSWSWSMTGGTPATSTVQNPSVTFNAAGTYSITLTSTNGGGSSSPVTLTLTVNSTPTVSISGATPICAGASATLTASGATTYTWNPGSMTGSSIVASPSVTTSYTLQGTSGSCVGTATAVVTVSAQPTISISGGGNICAGGSATLTAAGATTYSWNTGATTASISVSPVSNTIYTVTGTSGAGCTNVQTSTVSVNASPTVTIGGGGTICSGSTATLTAAGAASYTWSTGANTSSITVTPTVTTTYTLTGANGTCTGATMATVTVNANPNVTVNSSTICVGSTATLTASGASSYTWTPGGATTFSIAVSPGTTTIYTVDGSSGTCSATVTSTVTVNAQPTVTVNSATICAGNSATLTATGATTYSWSPATGLSATTGPSVTSNPSTSTSYTITGSNGACTGTVVSTVMVNALPVVTVNSSTICLGGSGALTASGASVYSWSPGSGLSATTGASVTANPSATITYTVTGTDVNGCSNTATSSVAVLATPTITVSASSNTICIGNTATLTASGAATYTWSNSATTFNIVVSPSTSTTYTVTGDNGAGCTSSQTITMNVAPLPTASMTASSNAACVGTAINFADASSGGTISGWSWDFGDGNTSVSINPSHTYTLGGMYMVRLAVTTNLGCSDTTFLNILSKSDTLSGSVTDTNNVAVTAGKVYVFTQNLTHAGLLDTMGYTSISAGNYAFPCLDTGNYILKVVADSLTYPTSIPTYFSSKPNAYQWDSATVISVFSYNVNVSGKNVKIIQTPLLSGPGIISGHISEGTGFGHRSGGGNNSVMGAPLKGVDIKLGKNPGGSAAARTTSDANGNYSFANVPVGSYKIYVDIPNYGMDSVLAITITSTSTVSTQNNYFVDSASVRVDTVSSVGIKQIDAIHNNLSVYPNPNNGSVTLKSKTDLGLIIIYNSLGEVVFKEKVNSNLYHIDLRSQAPGIYILQAQGNYLKLLRE